MLFLTQMCGHGGTLPFQEPRVRREGLNKVCCPKFFDANHTERKFVDHTKRKRRIFNMAQGLLERIRISLNGRKRGLEQTVIIMPTQLELEAQPEITIKLTTVLPRGNPEKEKISCSCGGTMNYTSFPYSIIFMGERVDIPEIYGWCCSQCPLKLFTDEVGSALEEAIRIERAKSDFSINL